MEVVRHCSARGTRSGWASRSLSNPPKQKNLVAELTSRSLVSPLGSPRLKLVGVLVSGASLLASPLRARAGPLFSLLPSRHSTNWGCRSWKPADARLSGFESWKDVHLEAACAIVFHPLTCCLPDFVPLSAGTFLRRFLGQNRVTVGRVS